MSEQTFRIVVVALLAGIFALLIGIRLALGPLS